MVIPGHGPIFSDAPAAIAFARERLRGFVAKPDKHIKHAVKVLLKFKLLELQSIAVADFLAWAQSTPYFLAIYQQHFSGLDFAQWVDELIADLVRAGAAAREGQLLSNVG